MHEELELYTLQALFSIIYLAGGTEMILREAWDSVDSNQL